MEISRDMIRRHILSKHTTLWGRSGDTTQQTSLEGLVDWQYDTIKELLAEAEKETESFTDRLVREQNAQRDLMFSGSTVTWDMKVPRDPPRTTPEFAFQKAAQDRYDVV